MAAAAFLGGSCFHGAYRQGASCRLKAGGGQNCPPHEPATFYSNSAISRIADQLPPSTAIHARKAEVGRINRPSASTLESAPLRRLSRECAQGGGGAANLDLCYIVNDDFNGALAPILSPICRIDAEWFYDGPHWSDYAD
jgi:hypothetical protein